MKPLSLMVLYAFIALGTLAADAAVMAPPQPRTFDPYPQQKTASDENDDHFNVVAELPYDGSVKTGTQLELLFFTISDIRSAQVDGKKQFAAKVNMLGNIGTIASESIDSSRVVAQVNFPKPMTIKLFGTQAISFRRGSLVFEKGKVSEEELTMAAIDAGAEDISSDDEIIEVVTGPDDFVKVKDALKAKGFTPASAEVSMTPSTTVKVEGEDAKKVIKLVSMLEDHDDVQAVHANFDISADILEQAT